MSLPGRKRNACLASMERMRGWRVDVSLNEMLTFLYLCENEGITVRELAVLTKLNESTASRTVARLAGDRGELGPGGAALIEPKAREEDRRGLALMLSDAGRALRSDLDALIAQAAPIGRSHHG